MEMLLTPGSTSQLVTRCGVLGKTFYVYFQMRPSSLSVVVAQPTKELQTESKKVYSA